MSRRIYTTPAFTISVKVAFGTAIYTLIVILASFLPTASGLMLTFPALNGLAYVFAKNAEVDKKTSTMIWMPMLNGLLCAVYIWLYLGWPSLIEGLELDFLTQLFAMLFVWSAIAWLLQQTPEISSGRRSSFTGFIVFACVMATVILWPPAPQAVSLPGSIVQTWDVMTILFSSREKIGLFATVLAIYLVICEFWSPSPNWKGVWAGLPLLPFFGLLSIAQNETIALDVRLLTLEQLILGLCLAPAIAVGFIYGVSVVLDRSISRGGNPGQLGRFGVVFCGWLLCALVITALSLHLPVTSMRIHQ